MRGRWISEWVGGRVGMDWIPKDAGLELSASEEEGSRCWSSVRVSARETRDLLP